MLLALLLLGANDRLMAQTGRGDVLAWVRENSIPLSGVEPASGSDDLVALGPLLGSARVVVLGESVHLAHEFLALRNRLFEYLVEELEFTAIAVESGFTESMAVNRYVQGGAPSDDVAKDVFSWTAPTVWAENRQLIDWMREYNSRSGGERKLHFYGIDFSGSHWGQGVQTPRIAVEAALAYLAGVAPELARRLRADLQAGLVAFNQDDYPTMKSEDQGRLSASLLRLVQVFESEQATLVARSTEVEYHDAYQHAVIARSVEALLRAQKERPNDFREIDNVRDEAMAANVQWILDRLGRDGRLMIFAHNHHAKSSPMWPIDDTTNWPRGPGTVLGEHLRAGFGAEMIVLGTLFGGGEAAYGSRYEQAERGSLEALMRAVGERIFLFELDAPGIPSEVQNTLARPWRLRFERTYGELAPTAAFDAFIYVDTITPSRVAAGSR